MVQTTNMNFGKQITTRIFAIAMVFCGMSLGAYAQSSMTDQQVLEYAKQAMAAGKSNTTIAKELMAKGVNRAQALRVRELYKKSMSGDAPLSSTQTNDDKSRAHTSTAPIQSATTRDQQVSVLDNDDLFDNYAEEDSLVVFGRDVFRNKDLNFAPSDNLATPRNYQLGPGDEVIIDIFGANQTTLRSTISPEGSINVDILGPVYLNGKTIEEANSFLKKKLASIYAGLNRNAEGTDIRLSLGQIRNIQINVMGDVVYPGTYSLSSFATVFHALYRAGGIKEPGTLRDIIVSRGGKTIAHVDVYEFLMNGSRSSDIRLEEGDVILVPSYKEMVRVKGFVKRPMLFELKEGETLSQLLEYAGGFAQGAYTNNVTVIRQNGKEYEVCTVNDIDFKVFKMKNGDELEVGELVSRFENRVSIKGAVYRNGIFQLNGETNTVKALIEKADGLLPDAFTNRGLLSRERDDRSLEVLQINVQGILDGSSPDIALRKNDELYIPSKYDLKDRGTLTITGEVAQPDTLVYADNMTLEDLIMRAGGLLESASLARVDVIRRIKDPNATVAQSDISEMYSFSVKDNYVIEGEVGFKLQPYDEVIVRRSPSYSKTRYVKVSGEANFPGAYPITKREERLSSLIEKAGGATDYAYLKGARLVRKVNKDELARMKTALKSNSLSGDSIPDDALNMESTYYVAIDLDKALEQPGGQYDVVLREGDELVLPIYPNTVSVKGAVLSPNEITYMPSRKAGYYIDQAGGYATRAKKSKKFMICMNGHIEKISRRTKVDPGAEIIVPMKGERKSNLQEIMGIATTATSLGTMAASIANILK